MSFLLNELTWPEAKFLIMQAKAAIIPVGGVVQHGPHLPLGTDSFAAEYYAKQVATRLYPYIVVTPTIPIGIGERHLATPGTLTVKTETLSILAIDIATSLSRHKLKKTVFFNCHTENKQALDTAVQRLKNDLHLESMVLHFRELFPDKGDEFLETKNWQHASELETSEALFMFPEKIKKDRIAGADNTLGVEGKASSATHDKGKQLVDSLVNIAVRLTEEFMLH
ncbi:MAG: creatininase family protein [Thermoproteota archaeon]